MKKIIYIISLFVSSVLYTRIISEVETIGIMKLKLMDI